MKQILISCLISIPVITLAQYRSFDFFQESSIIHSKGRQKQEIIKQYRLVNSISGDQLPLQKTGGKYIASLYDPVAGLLHYFNIYNTDTRFVAEYAMSYVHTDATSIQTSAPASALHTVATPTAPLEYELKVYTHAADKKADYIFQVKLAKAKYNDLGTTVDNPSVQNAVKNALTAELEDAACCHRIIGYKAQRRKGSYVVEYKIQKSTPVSIDLVVPQALRLQSK